MVQSSATVTARYLGPRHQFVPTPSPPDWQLVDAAVWQESSRGLQFG